MTTVKEQAEKDIRESLEIKGKSFIAFRSELDSIMDSIVENELKLRSKASKV